mmetsp:Transcript_16940/g.55579  ORF Transcript_16940/g.55579 Transcript_16940/m.55579 type:complete len:236 (-) Transcript_16940:65-772(-)
MAASSCASARSKPAATQSGCASSASRSRLALPHMGSHTSPPGGSSPSERTIAHATCGSSPPRVRHSMESKRRSSASETCNPSSLSETVTSSDGAVRSTRQPKYVCSAPPSSVPSCRLPTLCLKRRPRRVATTANERLDSPGWSWQCAASAAGQPGASATSVLSAGRTAASSSGRLVAGKQHTTAYMRSGSVSAASVGAADAGASHVTPRDDALPWRTLAANGFGRKATSSVAHWR